MRLLVSGLASGRWCLLLLLPAAYVLMFGELFRLLPPLEISGVTVPATWLVWSIGGALALLGMIVGRKG